MSLRFNHRAVSPSTFKVMMEMEKYISGRFIDKVLYELAENQSIPD